METTVLDLIKNHGGTTGTFREDEAYRFVTVTFSDFPDRETFIRALPAYVNWERGYNVATADLMIPLSHMIHTVSPVKPTPKPVRKPTAAMIDVMVRMFGGEEGGNMSVWTDTSRGDAFRKSTLKGLIARGFVQVMDDGWTVDALYITKLGVAWLVENKHAVVVEGRHVVAGVVPMTDVEISRHIRDAYLEAALYSQDVRVVGDYFNNVNRRADVIGVARPGQKSRQWEIVHQVKPYMGESTETLYLVYNTAVPEYQDYLVLPKSRLTNLY